MARKTGPERTSALFAQVEMETLICVDWFNNRRLLELIGNIPLITNYSA